jgi:predicted nucleotidyltransferase
MATKNDPALRAARRFIHAIEKSGIHLQAAYLYGSHARGQARVDSDIDIALVSKDFTGWVDDLPLIKPALLTMDSRIEHVRFHPRDFHDENPLVWEIKTTGLQLVGKQQRAKTNRRTERL